MATPDTTNNSKFMTDYHPLLKKVVPSPIIKISQDYSVNQYMLIFLLIAVGMGFLFLTGVLITKLVE